MNLILIGAISGAITGLGMGGGTILIIILTSFMAIEQRVAQAANLIFFIPTAITAIIVHFKNGNVEKRIGTKLVLTIAIGSIIGAFLTKLIDDKNLKRYFGIFLFGVGIIEMITIIINLVKKRKH